MKNILSLFVLVVATGSLDLFAQKQPYNEKVTVVAPYEPSISDARKINLNPAIEDTVVKIPVLTYSIYSKQMYVPFMLEPIKAAKIVGEPLTKLYKNYVKLGFGTYTTPYLEIFANNLRAKEYAYGVHLKHLSSTGKIKDYGYSGYSDNEVNVYGKKYLLDHTLQGELFYKRNVVHYYGFKPEDYNVILSKNSIKQRYSLVGTNFSLFSTYTDSSHLNHEINFKYYNLSDYYKSTENNILLDASLQKNVDWLKFTKSQTIGVVSKIDFYANQWLALPSDNNAVIQLKPYIGTTIDRFNFLIGVNAFITADEASHVDFYPVVEIKMSIVPQVFDAFAGVTGQTYKNSFKRLSDENPFIASDALLACTKEKLQVYGGVKSLLSKEMDMIIKMSYSSVEGMPMYINDRRSLAENMFMVIYDNATLFNLNANLAYQESEQLKIMLNANYYNYAMENELKAWQKPDFDMMLSAAYNLKNKIIFKGDLFAFGNRYAQQFVGGKETAKLLDGAVDLNLGVEYRYTKLLSAFVNFNNIGASRYFIWNNYPSQRFNLMAGITASF